MQLTGELAPLGLAHRQTEFFVPPPPAPAVRVFGACGPTALASSASAALQRVITGGDVYNLMRAHGLCDSQGISTDGALAAAAIIPASKGGLGLSIVEHYRCVVVNNVVQAWPAWTNFMGWHLGSRDHSVLLQVDNGQALRDEISGLGENAVGLRDHFIHLLKRHTGGFSAYANKLLPSGYWAADGDNYAGGNSRATNFAAADVLQFYSDTTLAAARPCAAIAFARQSASGGATAMWKVVSPGVVADSHGVQAKFAMAAYIEQHLDLDDVVAGCSGETYIDNGETSILPLSGATSLVYTKSSGHAAPLTGEDVWALWQRASAAEAHVVAQAKTLAAVKAALG